MVRNPTRRARATPLLVLALGALFATVASTPINAQSATGTPGPVVITTPTSLTPVRAIINPSFDTTAVGPGQWTFVEALNGTQTPQMTGWQSTHPPASNFGGRDHPIEVWGSPFQGVTSVSGPTLVELNANVSSAVFQDLCLEEDEQVAWDFHHHARSTTATEIVQVSISDPATWTGVSPPATPPYSSGSLSAVRSAGWINHSGSWNAAHSAGVYRFAFDAIQGGSGGPSYGNLLDDVEIDLDALAELITHDGVNPASTSESNGARLAFVVNGRLDGPTTIRMATLPSATIDGTDIAGVTVVDGSGASIAGAAATVLTDGSIDVTLPPATYWPNERSSYVQLLLDLTDAVNDTNEVGSWELTSVDPSLRPGDALCDGADRADVTFNITAALDLELSLTTPDQPAEQSDVVFTATVANVDGLPDPGPVEVRIAFTAAYNSLGGSGLGWSCSNNSTLVRCFFIDPLLPGETTPPLTVLTTIVGSVGSTAEAAGTAESTQSEANLTNNSTTISGPVLAGLPGTGIETDSGLTSGFSLLALGFALLWVAHRLDLRSSLLRSGMGAITRGSSHWRS